MKLRALSPPQHSRRIWRCRSRQNGNPYIIEDANPDGREAATRDNANGLTSTATSRRGTLSPEIWPEGQSCQSARNSCRG